MSSIQVVEVPSNGCKTLRPNVDWPELLNRVQQNQDGAGDELYSLISKGILFFLRRQMPIHLAEERMHDVFVIVFRAIRDGRIENANAFPGFVMTVAKRQSFHHIRAAVDCCECSNDFVVDHYPSDAKANPYSLLEAQQRATLLREVLGSMRPYRREILNRFYVLEQSQEQICAEMNLTDVQFRLLKNRAKTEFGERGRKMMAPRKPLSAGIVSGRLSDEPLSKFVAA